MTQPHLGRSSLQAIGAAVAAVTAVVVLLVAFEDRPSPDDGTGVRPPPGATAPLRAALPAPLPTPPTPDTVDAPVAGLPHAAPEGDAIPVSVEAAVSRPTDASGRTVRCISVDDALPRAWKFGKVGAPAGAGGGRVGAFLRRAAAGLADHRLTLQCRSAALDPLAIDVYFDRDAAAAIPAIGRGTVVVVQLIGPDPTGRAAARYLHVAAAPRPGQADPGMPDLLGALTGATAATAQVTCHATDWAALVAPSQVDVDVTASLAGEDGAWGEVRCRDRRGVAVPVIVRAEAAHGRALLSITAGTAATLRVAGSAGDKLVASLVGVTAGAARVDPDDLRLPLIDRRSAAARTVVCHSMGVPQPQPVGPTDPDAASGGTRLADRKAWVVCAQGAAPPVEATLYFAAGAQRDLLAIGRGTAFEAELLGVAEGRLRAVFQRALHGMRDPAQQAADLRRFALLGRELDGVRFACRLAAAPTLAPVATVPPAAVKLKARPVDPDPAWFDCTDGAGSSEGQRFLVFVARGPGPSASVPAAGATVDLIFAGSTDSVLAAVWVPAPQPQ